MGFACDAVQHQSCKAQPRIEHFKAANNSRNASRALRCVHHEDHRKRQHFGNLSRAAFAALPGDSIEQAHHAFDDCDVRVRGGTSEYLAVRCLIEHPAIQIPGRPSSDSGKMASIEEVRTALESLYGEPARLKTRAKRKRCRSFSHTTGWTCD